MNKCQVCAEMYQIIGAMNTVNCKTQILDNLSASATGKPLPHKTLLPYPGLDLNDLERRLDEALEKETPESLQAWIRSKE